VSVSLGFAVAAGAGVGVASFIVTPPVVVIGVATTPGGTLAFGSDWPVVTLNPWYGVQNAVTRQTRDGKPAGGFVPQERLTLEQAIEGYTLGAAKGARRERTEGSIQPGKLADVIMLSRDLFKTDPSQIYKTEVAMTMVGGKVVYRAKQAATSQAAQKGTK